MEDSQRAPGAAQVCAETSIGPVSVDEIVAALHVRAPAFPRDALLAAERKPAGLTERLIEVIQTVRGNAIEGELAEDNAHIFAMMLLAEFGEARALQPILDLFALPEDLCDELVGEFITEDLGRVLASVCGGQIEKLQRIVEDGSRGGYVRGAALNAIVALVARKLLHREEAVAYLEVLVRGRLEREPSSVWDTLGYLVLDLHAEDLFDDIHAALREGLIDPFMLSPRGIERERRSSTRAAMDRLERDLHLQPVRDVVAEMEWWACFNPRGYSRSGRGTGGAPSSMKEPQPAAVVTPVRRSEKPGRNDPCPCGSDKKYKKCCLGKE